MNQNQLYVYRHKKTYLHAGFLLILCIYLIYRHLQMLNYYFFCYVMFILSPTEPLKGHGGQ